jgi:hypothetical protein
MSHRSAQSAGYATPSGKTEHDDRVSSLEANIECSAIVAVNDPLIAGNKVAEESAPPISRSLDPAGLPVVTVEMDDRKPSSPTEFLREDRFACPAGTDHGYPSHASEYGGLAGPPEAIRNRGGRVSIRAAGPTHSDWAEFDRVMSEKRRTAVLVDTRRIHSNHP